MRFAGQVAVITGAASGIGRGLALEAGRRGMRVAIADIDQANLNVTYSILQEMGVEASSHVLNVAVPDEMEIFATQIFDLYGAVFIFFNNAGVHIDGPSWNYTDAQWKWLFDVNVFGVVNGTRSFLPKMIQGGGDGIIANTASLAGLISFPYSGCYCASKHAIVGFTESVHFELLELKSRIRMALICPGAVATAIAAPSKAALAPAIVNNDAVDPSARDFHINFESLIQSGMSADEHAKFVFEEILKERFWIISDESYFTMIEERLQSISEHRPPKFGA